MRHRDMIERAVAYEKQHGVSVPRLNPGRIVLD